MREKTKAKIALLVLSLTLVAALGVGALSTPPAGAQEAEAGGDGVSGLPIPRFVSLRSNEVNLRTGPGLTYPILWIYKRKMLPVEVIEEYDTWRKIREIDGTEGWVHQTMLDGARSFVVVGEERSMKLAPQENAEPAARLEPGVIGSLIECQAEWCRGEVEGYRGWLRREWIWGAYPGEIF